MSFPQTTAEELEKILASSAAASDEWAATAPSARAKALTAAADALDEAAPDLIPIAQRETHLAEARLQSELKRTTFQLRLFAEVLAEGSYLDVRIDPADAQWPMGAPRPDLRRVLIPLGPVVVFAASNFPFAFSTAGGDTASALAAGCSVVLKVHSGHPELSAATGRVIAGALAAAGAPAGLFSLVFGTDAGRSALTDARVKAGSFTGSIPAGRTLLDLANSRPEPIPFFAEMGSVNPVFVTRSAAANRGEEIAQAFIGSVTASAGQLCTKPGVLLVPEESGIVAYLGSQSLPAPGPLLNERIMTGFMESLKQVAAHPGVKFLAEAPETPDHLPASAILVTTAEDLLRDPDTLLAECFGPASLVVTYQDEAQLTAVARVLEGQLTATIHGEAGDDVQELVRLLAKRAGRLLWNQWPTGVSVTYAQQHGGPYPATSASASTSVGTAAITRFLRPVAYQGFPQELLPEAIRDENPLGVPRRVNGGFGGE
jgi:NADP-dependent aldehyde dehydrogenase